MLAGLGFWCFLSATHLTASAEVNWEAYETGVLGSHPQVEYHSARTVQSPLIHVVKRHTDCNNGHVLLSPDGPRIRGNKAMIFDHNGHLIWSQKELGNVKSFQVQKYKGADYLTYWVGDDDYPGHGHGYFKMLDQTYSLAFAFSALNNLDGDYHEFIITPQNTAIITAYQKTPWNLKSLGRDSGYIWDCVFQEIDIENEFLIFEWRASDHFSFDDMSVNSWEEYVGTEQNPWDWFHLNSVQKDPWGNYLIAARYTNAVSYIDGATGRPLWHLGGIRNSFRDLTKGNATAFVDPHMARWADSYSAITVFDNVGFRLLQESGKKRSSAIKLQVDTTRRRVVSTTDFSHPNALFAESEGSMQRLNNGNYFVGYGSAAVYSEFSPDGKLICDANYSPLNMSVESGVVPHKGAVQSYRIYKHTWKGDPKARPDVSLSKGRLYVSWNGATEVEYWKVIAQGIANGGEWILMGIFQKTGFETAIDLQSDSYSLFRLVALDKSNNSIRSWSIHPEGSIWEMYIEQTPVRSHSSFGLYSLSFFLGCACVFLLLQTKCLTPRKGRIPLSWLQGRGEGRNLKQALKKILPREPV